MLFISRSRDLWKTLLYVRLCRSYLLRSSASSFSSQYLLLFLRSSRSCVLLLPILFTSVSLSFNCIIKKAIFFLENYQFNLLFLSRTLFRGILFSLIHSRTSSLVTYFLWSFYLLHYTPEPHKWLGHVNKMNSNTTTKHFFTIDQLLRKRKVRRGLKWINSTKRLKRAGIRNWTSKLVAISKDLLREMKVGGIQAKGI